jgi:hypothetical protein
MSQHRLTDDAARPTQPESRVGNRPAPSLVPRAFELDDRLLP